MSITLIKYKPSGKRYCGGYLMDSWGSEFDVSVHMSVTRAAQDMLYTLKHNKNNIEEYEPEWSVSVVINGVVVDIIGDDIYCSNSLSYEFDDDGKNASEARMEAKGMLKLAESLLKKGEAEQKRIRAQERAKKKEKARLKRDYNAAVKAKKEQDKLDILRKTIGV